MPQREHLAQAAFLVILSELMFASMGAAVKAASGLGMPNEVLVFMRNLGGILILLPLLLRRGLGNLHTEVFHLHFMRAIFGLAAMYCFFYALGNLPLAGGMLLKMTSPLFLPLVAFVWLSERPAPLALAAVPIGFIGVAVVLHPEGKFGSAALVGLLGGALASVAKVTVRRLGRSEPAVRTVFYFGLLATAVSMLPAWVAWRPPTGDQWLLLAAVALLGTAGQLLLTRGYVLAEAGRVGPFTYFSVLFGAVYGYLFWDEVLGAWFVGGALLIAVAGLMTFYGRVGRARAAHVARPATNARR